MMLMLAEAYVEQNRLPEALTIVNQVRDRAAVNAQGCGDASVAKKYPSCAGNTSMTAPMPAMAAGKSLLPMPWARYEIGECLEMRLITVDAPAYRAHGPAHDGDSPDDKRRQNRG